MSALLLVGVLLAVGLGVMFWRDRKDRLDKEARAELERLRVEQEQDQRVIDAITRLVMDHMDVEPFARVVWDELRTSNRKELP